MLIDAEKQMAYLPVPLALLEELKEWSKPVQIRWQIGYETLEIRTMAQPVKGVYITEEDSNTGKSHEA